MPGTGQVLTAWQPGCGPSRGGRGQPGHRAVLHTQGDPSEQADSKEREARLLTEEEARPLGARCRELRGRETVGPGLGTGPWEALRPKGRLPAGRQCL